MQDVERLLESKQWGVQAQQTVWWRSDQAVADGAFRICCQPFGFKTPAVSWEENVAVWGILPWIYDIWLLSLNSGVLLFYTGTSGWRRGEL